MNWAAARRIDFIDGRLATYGEIRREHITTAFGVSVMQASKDLGAYRMLYPGVIIYDPKRKLYRPRRTPYKPRRSINTTDRQLIITVEL